MSEGVPAHTGYRSDIDGLRAVAVLSVILFHASARLVPGGFSGVDVFFVISGYLITGILRRELAAGTFSFARFYERRARRILPALLLVLAVTLGASWLLVLPDDLPAIGRSAVAVLVFAANIAFWRGVDFGDLTTVNYFGKRIHEQPLVHTWSLGVEEQYYLLFPLALFLAWRVSKSLMVPALVAAFAASLALSVWLTPGSPGVAFYLLPARGWELLAGGLVAWAAPPPTGRHRAWHEAAAIAGLLLIVAAAAFFDSATPFPGYAAAVPVAGAVLLLRYAPGSRAGALLSWPPLVFVGLISYSAYLWHQPLFALARYVSLDGEPRPMIAAALVVITLVLATLTWRYVETPFRDSRRVPRRRLVWAMTAATVLVAIPASLAAFATDAGRKTPIATNRVTQALISMFADCSLNSPLRALGAGCVTDPSSPAAPSFLVTGDSHAHSMFAAFARLSRETGRQGRLFALDACSPLLEVADVPTSTPGCIETRERGLAMVAGGGVPVVFLVSRFSYAYGPMDRFEARLARTIDAYAQRGAVVHLVTQAPEQPRFSRRSYLRAVLLQRFFRRDAGPVLEEMSATRAEDDAQQAFVRAAFDRYRDDPRVRLIDFRDALCDAARCQAGTSAVPYYVDDHHLSVAGAALVSASVQRQSQP